MRRNAPFRYRFRALLLNMEPNPAARRKPEGVDELRWREALEEAGGERNAEGMWPVLAEGFADLCKRYGVQTGALAEQGEALERAAHLCMTLGTDGLRGELTLIRAGRALAAFDNKTHVGDAELKRIAPMALSHRMRRTPLDESGSAARVERALAEVFK